MRLQFGFGLEMWGLRGWFFSQWLEIVFHFTLCSAVYYQFFSFDQTNCRLPSTAGASAMSCNPHCKPPSLLSVFPFVEFKFPTSADSTAGTDPAGTTPAGTRGRTQGCNNTLRLEKRDQSWKLSLINNMALIIGVFNCPVTYTIVKGKPPDTWKLFFNYWRGVQSSWAFQALIITPLSHHP